MTDNFGLGRIATGMSLTAQGTKANDMVGGIDAALTEDLTVVFDSTTETLTAFQFISNFTFYAEVGSPAPGGACTLNVPNVNAEATTLKRGAFTVVNNTGQDLTVQVSGQSETPPTLSTGQASILVMDGTHVRLAVPQGAIGGDGADGTDPGLLYDFATATADADPGAGTLQANNADLSVATQLLIDDLDRSAGNHEAFLLTWDDSTNTVKGHVILKRVADDATAVFKVTAVTDATGYVKITVEHESGVTAFSAADVISVQWARAGDAGAAGTSGASALTVVRVVDTTGADPATAYESGDTINGVVLATNDLVLRASAGGNASDGVYVVPASGAASRHTSFDAYDELPGTYFSVMEGTAKADTLWRCTSDRGGTIDVTALAISEFSSGGGGSGWVLVDEWVHSIDGTVANFDVTGVDAYSELLIEADGVTTSASGFLAMLASVDGGSTYHNTSGNYQNITNAGALTNSDVWGIFNSSAISTARTAFIQAFGTNLSGNKKMTFGSISAGGVFYRQLVVSTAPVDAIRLICLSSSGNLTGGAIRVFGRS